MQLHIINLLKHQLGTEQLLRVIPRFESVGDVRVMVVNCRPSGLPVYLKDGSRERFYVRTGGATAELSASKIQACVRQRF